MLTTKTLGRGFALLCLLAGDVAFAADSGAARAAAKRLEAGLIQINFLNGAALSDDPMLSDRRRLFVGKSSSNVIDCTLVGVCGSKSYALVDRVTVQLASCKLKIAAKAADGYVGGLTVDLSKTAPRNIYSSGEKLFLQGAGQPVAYSLRRGEESVGGGLFNGDADGVVFRFEEVKSARRLATDLAAVARPCAPK